MNHPTDQELIHDIESHIAMNFTTDVRAEIVLLLQRFKALQSWNECVWCSAPSDTKDPRCPAPDGDGHLFSVPVTKQSLPQPLPGDSCPACNAYGTLPCAYPRPHERQPGCIRYPAKLQR